MVKPPIRLRFGHHREVRYLLGRRTWQASDVIDVHVAVRAVSHVHFFFVRRNGNTVTRRAAAPAAGKSRDGNCVKDLAGSDAGYLESENTGGVHESECLGAV